MFHHDQDKTSNGNARVAHLLLLQDRRLVESHSIRRRRRVPCPTVEFTGFVASDIRGSCDQICTTHSPKVNSVSQDYFRRKGGSPPCGVQTAHTAASSTPNTPHTYLRLLESE